MSAMLISLSLVDRAGRPAEGRGLPRRADGSHTAPSHGQVLGVPLSPGRRARTSGTSGWRRVQGSPSVVRWCDVVNGHSSRMTKRPIMIRNQTARGTPESDLPTETRARGCPSCYRLVSLHGVTVRHAGQPWKCLFGPAARGRYHHADAGHGHQVARPGEPGMCPRGGLAGDAEPFS